MKRGEYPDDWDDRRERVLQRDGYQCQDCGETEATLQVHHITPISDGGSHQLSNLETVCRSCHATEHPQKITLNSALQDNIRIRMKYTSSSGTRVREVNPYALQMHEGIQYLVGYDYYRGEIRHFRPTRIKWVEQTDRQFNPPSDFSAGTYLQSNLRSRGQSQKGSQSGCFIATAAYGTPQAEEIDQLRDFRDNVLLNHILGVCIVRAYYKISPPIAAWISRKRWRRNVVRKIVVGPALTLTEINESKADGPQQ